MTRDELKIKKIGVLMGGLSAEREVSLKSGAAMAEALRSRGYQVTEIDVDRNLPTVLSREEEAMIVAFRRHTLLPFDDFLYALQPTIPHLTRSSLHRCL